MSYQILDYNQFFVLRRDSLRGKIRAVNISAKLRKIEISKIVKSGPHICLFDEKIYTKSHAALP